MLRKISVLALAMVMLITAAPSALAQEESAIQGQDAEATAVEESNEAVKDEPLIDAVKDAKVKKSGKCKLKVTWSTAEDADGYYIYRSKKENSGFKKIKTLKDGSKNSFTQQVVPNTTYFYMIKAYGTFEVASDSGLNKGNQTTTKEKPIVGEASDTVSGKIKPKKSFKVKAYAYSGGGYTASGKKAKVGRIAVDPKVIPLGTWLYVPGYGLCQACDTGGAIKGKVIDVYMNTNKECSRWGVKYPKIYIL